MAPLTGKNCKNRARVIDKNVGLVSNIIAWDGRSDSDDSISALSQIKLCWRF